MSATIHLLGNVGRAPESGMTQGQNPTQRARFSLAVNRKQGDQDATDWFDVTFFGKQAETIVRHVQKGSPLYVVGELSVTEKDGKRYLDVRGLSWKFAGPKPQGGEQRSGSDWGAKAEARAPFDDGESPLPF